jgi:hypothetical protein
MQGSISRVKITVQRDVSIIVLSQARDNSPAFVLYETVRIVRVGIVVGDD